MQSLGDEVSIIWWAAQQKWAKDNPDKVTAFKESLDDAADFIEKNDGEARDILQK